MKTETKETIKTFVGIYVGVTVAKAALLGLGIMATKCMNGK